MTRKSESKGSQKQSKGEGLLTVSKSNQVKITLPNLKNGGKSANRGVYRNTIAANRTVPLCFQLMNDIDLEERVREILHLIKLYKNVENTQESLEVFRLFIRYLTRAAKYINKDQLEKSVQKELPEWRSDYMTIADVLRKEGIEKGKKETAINFYKMGLTIDQIAQGTGLDKETLQEILKDVER